MKRTSRAPTGLWARWRVRLDARALRPLRRPGLPAGLWDTEGPGSPPAPGTPPGGTVSPVLAQGSRHEALALGWANVVQPRWRGDARRCREAEDGGCACRVPEDAARCLRGRPPRRATGHRPVAPAPEAALPLSGMRGVLDTSAARRAPRQAASRPPAAPRRVPPVHGRAPTPPASAGAGLRPASAGAMTGPLQRRGRARDRPRAARLCAWGDRLDVSMAQAAGRQAAPRPVGAVSPRPRRTAVPRRSVCAGRLGLAPR